MIYNKLGKTGLSVSRIGVGGIPIQRTTKEATAELFEMLAENGVNYIDTARGYTCSEEYIGYALESRGLRNKYIIATKSFAKTCDAMAADIDISLKNLKTDYIDLYQLHNPAPEAYDAVCSEDGALAACIKAKKDGKIGHIGITAHSIEVFERALENPVFETIMFPYNIVESQGAALIDKCRERNVGFIAMKPLAGGAIEDAEAAVRYICANPAVSIVIPGMYNTDEARQNIAAAENTAPISLDEEKRFAAIRSTLTGNFCRRCNYCAPCTVGISIPNVFLYSGYLERYGLEEWARARYAGLEVKAGACIGCGACETRCPYHLPIREMLKKCVESFGE